MEHRHERPAEQILQLVAELRLWPGDRMATENELAARLGARRGVVREVVKILSALGRVRAQKGRGIYVADDDGRPVFHGRDQEEKRVTTPLLLRERSRRCVRSDSMCPVNFTCPRRPASCSRSPSVDRE